MGGDRIALTTARDVIGIANSDPALTVDFISARASAARRNLYVRAVGSLRNVDRLGEGIAGMRVPQSVSPHCPIPHNEPPSCAVTGSLGRAANYLQIARNFAETSDPAYTSRTETNSTAGVTHP